jgi:hypothetical protein
MKCIRQEERERNQTQQAPSAGVPELKEYIDQLQQEKKELQQEKKELQQEKKDLQQEKKELQQERKELASRVSRLEMSERCVRLYQ